jgi:Carboxypeptidase regulatory-like domain/TonB dependent receptor/TonB-dependent Receptor Plug Domain
MKFSLKLISLVLSGFLCLTIAFGQERTGSIEGNVVDPAGAVVPGATVKVSGVNVGFNQTTTTNDEGTFRLLQVPPGEYKITVSAGSFATSESNLFVRLGQQSSVAVALKVSVGNVNVVVDGGEVAAIETGSNKIQTSIDERRAELTPKANINFSGLLTLSPATRNEPLGAGFNIDGASGAENTFIVDGLEVTNFRSGQLRNVQNIPNSAVSEVQVKTSGFESEFGGATGGVVTVVTRGGSNRFAGEIGTQFTASKLNAVTRPVLNTALIDRVEYFNFRRGESGTFLNPADGNSLNTFPSVRVGGRIIKDRLWFFVNAAPQFSETTQFKNFPGSSVTERNFSRQRNDYYIGRIDAQPFSKLRLTGTYSYSPQVINGNVQGFAETTSRGNLEQRGGVVKAQNFTYSGVYTPTSNIAISVRGGRSFQNEKDGAFGTPSGVRYRCSGSQTILNTLSGFGCGANNQIGFDNIGDNSVITRDISVRNTFDVDGSVVANLLGSHIFKGGYQLNRVRNDVSNGYFAVGQIRFFFGTTAFGVGNANGNVQLTRFGTAGNTSSNNQALFIQDTWQIAKRLTLNLGLRIEKENVPSFGAVGVPIIFGYGDKPAPRVGFAYDVFGDGKTKVFASFGWFYDRFKYELPRGSFGGDQFLRTFAPIVSTNINTYTAASILASPGALTLDFRVPSNSPADNRVDPNLKAQRLSEFTVGVDRELFRDIVLRGRYTRKNLDFTIEDVGFFDNTGNENFFIANPGFGVVANPFATGLPATPKAVRRYDALEITLNKRFSNKYFINGSYIYSRLFGNTSGLASSDERGRSSPNVNRAFDLPFLGFNTNGTPDNGRLATDRPHAVKIFAGYSFDWFGKSKNSTDFTTSFLGTSGTPLSTQVSLFNANTFLFGRGDLGRTERFTQTDFAITHKYKFGSDSKYGIALEVNVINLLNQNHVLDVSTSISATDITGQERGFNLFTNCPGGVCDELNTIRAIFRGGIQSQLLNLINTTVIIDPTNTNPALRGETINRDPKYLQPTTFQTPRSVRFGFRFSF